MSGHFEGGIWIEDPKPPIEPMIMNVKISIDDSEVQNLKKTFEALQFTIEILCQHITKIGTSFPACCNNCIHQGSCSGRTCNGFEMIKEG